MAVQQAKLTGARKELKNAQELLDSKQKELDAVQILFDTAMSKKQVRYHQFFFLREESDKEGKEVVRNLGERAVWGAK